MLAVDKMIGDLQAAVAASGQAENTYFVFSSDNGLHMGEHRLMPGKMTAFDTDIHVPLIVTGPGIARGRTLEEVVENTDLCPTFAELADAVIPATADGRSLVPLLRGQQVPEWRTWALVEHHIVLRSGPRNRRRSPLARLKSIIERNTDDPDAPGIRSGNPPTYKAIRARASMYVEYNDRTREYHDLASDPYELKNTYLSLSPVAKASLHATVVALHGCHGAQACWQAALPAAASAQK